MRTANVDVTKIDKTAIHVGAKGKYIDLIFFDNKDGKDQYGNDGYVVQGISKERRDAGERGPIIGNWKDTEKRETPPAGRYENAAAVHGGEGDDIPFAPFEKHSPLPM